MYITSLYPYFQFYPGNEEKSRIKKEDVQKDSYVFELE